MESCPLRDWELHRAEGSYCYGRRGDGPNGQASNSGHLPSKRHTLHNFSSTDTRVEIHVLNIQISREPDRSIPHPVIDQFHILTSHNFPAPTSPPPTRRRGCLPTRRRTINSDFNAAAFAGVAQRPKCAPSVISRSNHQQPL